MIMFQLASDYQMEVISYLKIQGETVFPFRYCLYRVFRPTRLLFVSVVKFTKRVTHFARTTSRVFLIKRELSTKFYLVAIIALYTINEVQHTL